MRRFLAIAGSLALVSCAAILGIDDGTPRDDDAGLDAATADVAMDAPAEAATEAPPPPPCDVTTPFGTPVPITELNTTSAEEHPHLTPDELTIYYQSNRNGGAGKSDIWRATRPTRTSPFAAPVNLSGINTTGQEADPAISADGLTLLFFTDRSGGGDIWFAQAADGGFGAPAMLPLVNTSSLDFGPSLQPGALVLYFASARNSDAGLTNVFVASSNDAGVTGVSSVGPVNTANHKDGYPAISADGLVLYFASDRPTNGLGDWDVWVSVRASTADAFGTPTDVTEVNTSSSDEPGWLSADLCRLYLSSSRGGNNDLYIAERAPP